MKRQLSFANALVLCGGLAAACEAAPMGTAPWSPSKTLLVRLAPAASDGKYQIRPPRGYVLQTLALPGGSHGDGWIGPTRADQSRPSVTMLFLTPPAGEENKYTLEQFSARMLASVKRSRTNWKQSPTEQGSVNGLTFLRARWQGTSVEVGRPMSGFSYVTKDGNTFVQLSSQDFVPYQKEALSLAEASALTFQKH